MADTIQECPNCERYRRENVRLRSDLADLRRSDSEGWSLSSLQTIAVESLRLQMAAEQSHTVKAVHIACLRAARIRSLADLLGRRYAEVCEEAGISVSAVTQAKTPKRVGAERPTAGSKLSRFVERASAAVDRHRLEQLCFAYYLRLAGCCVSRVLEGGARAAWPDGVADLLDEHDAAETTALIQCGWSPDDETDLAIRELARRRGLEADEATTGRWRTLAKRYGAALLIAFYLGDRNHAARW